MFDEQMIYDRIITGDVNAILVRCFRDSLKTISIRLIKNLKPCFLAITILAVLLLAAEG